MQTWNTIRPRAKQRLLLFIIISFIIGLTLNYYRPVYIVSKTDNTLVVPSHVRIIDPDAKWLNRRFPCLKTKQVLHYYQTTLCRHFRTDTISGAIIKDRIWEETDLVRIMKILIRHPQLDMIDIGANIGGYTMFVAGGLGRLTIAIDCYLGNIERIARAAQLERVQNRVILIHNALYISSGKSIVLSADDPSGMRIANETQNKTANSPMVVTTIRFDDLLPLLEEKHVKKALIKIDVETSESYLCETGAKVFDRIDIAYIMMEWHHWRTEYQARYQFIVDFLTKRTYIPTDDFCRDLDTGKWLRSWPGNVFWIKRIYRNDSFCLLD